MAAPKTQTDSKPVLFHRSKRFAKSLDKSRHRAGEGIGAVKVVLRRNPDYGDVIPKRDGLRKMRLHVPSLKTGKRDGYRLIYRKAETEEVIYVLFLEAYFKGDKDDLNNREYDALIAQSEWMLDHILELDWEQ